MFLFSKVKFGEKRKIGLGGSGSLKDCCLVKELNSEKYDGGEDIEEERR